MARWLWTGFSTGLAVALVISFGACDSVADNNTDGGDGDQDGWISDGDQTHGKPDAVPISLIGSWQCSQGSDLTSGPCPAGHRDENGDCTFSSDASGINLVLGGGIVCSPVEACSLACVDNNFTYTCQNTVDSGSGQYSSNLTFYGTSQTTAYGVGTVSFNMGQGLVCTWRMEYLLNKS